MDFEKSISLKYIKKNRLSDYLLANCFSESIFK